MITANSVKRLAYAITKVSKINTSFHHYLKTENPDSTIKNGQALQLISKAFGYKTYKGFSLDLEIEAVDFSKFLDFKGKTTNYKSWIETVKEVAKLESDFVALTLAGLTYFLMQNTFDQSSTYYRNDFNTLLQAIQPTPIWTSDKSDLMLSGVVSNLMVDTVPDDEDQEDINLMCKVLYATNYYFFESLFRCAVFNTVIVHEYAMKMHIQQKSLHKISPVVFTKAPKEKQNDANLIYTLNLLVGDFLTSTTSVQENVLGEIATIPYHRATMYADSAFKSELWSPSEIAEPKSIRHQRLTQFFNSMRLTSCDSEKQAMFDRYMQKHNIPVYDYNDFTLLISDPTWLNPYIGQMYKTQEFVFVFDTEAMCVTHVEGLQANLYMNMLRRVQSVLSGLIHESIINLDECLFIDRFGMLSIHPDHVDHSIFTLKNLSEDGQDQPYTLNASELSLILNVAIMNNLVSELNDHHINAFKWMYLGMLLQFQCYYYGALKSGVSKELFKYFAPILGVPLPKSLQTIEA